MEWLHSLLHTLFEIHLWMDPQLCTPTTWYRWWITGWATYVGLVYLQFFFTVRFRLKKALRHMIGENFPTYLSYVFLFCGLIHLIGGWSYQNELLKLGFLLYPLLGFFHTMLLFTSTQIKHNIVVADEAMEDYKSEKITTAFQVKQINKLEAEKAEIIKTVSRAVIYNDMTLLKEILDD